MTGKTLRRRKPGLAPGLFCSYGEAHLSTGIASVDKDTSSRSENQHLQTCPRCDRATSVTPRGLTWCGRCKCGWESPQDYARRHRLRPHQARQDLVERLPFHHRGKPIVLVNER